MTEAILQHMHEDLESLKSDISLIKHLLLEEGELREETKIRLAKARSTPLSEYEEL
ncbi:hypothetical protein HYX14_02080 [Candidatus Woesearchaeota archaeon]|nr:hypothetical protein [Candidatus Woesearchaeota archaeon]